MTVSSSSKHFLLLLLFFLLSQFLFAQEFTKAPVPKVKQIIEWVQKKGNKKAQKGFSYTFDKKGNLLNFESNLDKDFPIHGDFKYDNQGRCISSEKIYGARYETTEFVYKKNTKLAFFYYRGDEFKTFYFYDDENKLLEKKTFLDSMDLDEKYILTNREIYHYNKKDSLTGVMHYIYDHRIEEPFLCKVIHHYDKKTGKRRLTEHLGLDGDNYSYEYTYDNRKRLIKKTIDLHDGSKDITTYEYQNGALFLETFTSADYVIKKIYKKGRLIRKRSQWMGEDWEIVDFQYKF